MTSDQVKVLVVETVTSPAQAARKVLDWAVPMQGVWLGITLIAVLNGMYYAMLLPRMAQSGLTLPPIVESPLAVALFILTIFVTMVYLTVFSGRMLGGTGDIERIGKITVWLQGLRFGAQVVISLISMVSPLIGWLASTALGFWGIWILLNFVAEAHGFTIPKAIGTMVMTFIGLVLIMSILSAVFGLTPPVPNGEL